MITPEEKEALAVIAETEGGEFTAADQIFYDLRDRGLLTISGKRGPNKAWFRIELTQAGLKELQDSL